MCAPSSFPYARSLHDALPIYAMDRIVRQRVFRDVAGGRDQLLERTYHYDRCGWLARVEDSRHGTRHFTHDSNGWLRSEERRVGKDGGPAWAPEQYKKKAAQVS